MLGKWRKKKWSNRTGKEGSQKCLFILRQMLQTYASKKIRNRSQTAASAKIMNSLAMHVAAASNPTACAEILGIQKDPLSHRPQIPGIADDNII